VEWREDQKTENIMGASASRRHQDKPDNHEERIGVVEKRLNIVRAAG